MSPIVASKLNIFEITKITQLERHLYRSEKLTVAARKLVANAKKFKNISPGNFFM